jgi:putative cell wall-binding protein
MHHKRTFLCVVLGALILIAMLPAVACAIPRDVVLARGKVWVDRNVPYSQQRYATVGGTVMTTLSASSASKKGYRTDCSGYVSMCMGLTTSKGLPLSLDTASLPSVLATVSKSQLLPGDAILRPKRPSDGVSGHVMLFVGWADAAKDKYYAYEERGTGFGTVRSVRSFSQVIGWGYHACRYKKIDDFYADCEQAIYSSSPYVTASMAAQAALPMTATVPALVITNADEWTGNAAASALASACGGPVLLTAHNGLPGCTAAAIKRLKPWRVYLIGGTSTISTTVAGQVAKLVPRVTRLTGPSRYAVAGRAACTAQSLLKSHGRTVDTAYLIGKDSFDSGVAVAAVSAFTGRPVFIGSPNTATMTTLRALKAAGIKHVLIVGGKDSIGSKVVRELKARGITVARIAGVDRYETALRVAQHGAGLGMAWTHLGISTGVSPHGMLACAMAQGRAGSLVLFTTSNKLPSVTQGLIAAKASVAGVVRIFGDFTEVTLPVRTAIANVLRAAK